MTNRVCICTIITLPWVLVGSSVSAAPMYSFFETVDNPADPTFNELLGINNEEMIGGFFGVGNSAHPSRGYALVLPSTYTNVNFPGSLQTRVTSILQETSLLQTGGFWTDSNGNDFGFLQMGNTFRSVNDPNVPTTGRTETRLLSVNQIGTMAAGFYIDANGNPQGFTYGIAFQTFTPITLPASFSAVKTIVTGINNGGILSGYYIDTLGKTHGFLDVQGNFEGPFDAPYFVGNTITFSQMTMFLGLNNSDVVVGSYVDANGVTHGLVYNTHLNNPWITVDDPSASATSAFGINGTTINGINDQGDLVGFFSDGTNVNGLFSVPSPEPSSFISFTIGAVLLIVRMKLTKKRYTA